MIVDEFTGRLKSRIEKSLKGFAHIEVDMYEDPGTDRNVTIQDLRDMVDDVAIQTRRLNSLLDRLFTEGFANAPVSERLDCEEKSAVRVPGLGIDNQSYHERVGAGMLACVRNDRHIQNRFPELARLWEMAQDNFRKMDGIVRLFNHRFQ